MLQGGLKKQTMQKRRRILLSFENYALEKGYGTKLCELVKDVNQLDVLLTEYFDTLRVKHGETLEMNFIEQHESGPVEEFKPTNFPEQTIILPIAVVSLLVFAAVMLK